MTKELITDVMQQMLPHLDNSQLLRLRVALESALVNYSVSFNDIQPLDNDNNKLVEEFLAAKRIEGCSIKTLYYYKHILNTMLDNLRKNACRITTEDIRSYLLAYQKEKQPSLVTIDNTRRILSSFFSWLEDEEYIIKNPVRRIHKIKTATTIKEVFSDEDIVKMKDSCVLLRDLALIELLSSTGMRIGELVRLNREDIDFEARECLVLGKGNKERIVYFDASTRIHLQEYLDSRTDSNPALFVSLRAPFERIQIGGIEHRLRNIGIEMNITHIHPHKFRRTLATKAIDKGMPIEQLQKLLGHQRIDTTLMYAMVKQSNVKIAHRKYLS